jgi:hypothetical protein
LAASRFARALDAARLALALAALALAALALAALALAARASAARALAALARAARALAASALAALAFAALALAWACAAASACAVDAAEGLGVVAAPCTRGVARAGSVAVAVAVPSTDEAPVFTASELLKAVRPSTSTPSHNAGRPNRISCRFGDSHSGGQAHSMGSGHSHTMTAARSARTIQMKKGMST